MTTANKAIAWLKPYLTNVPPLAIVNRSTNLAYIPTVSKVVNSGVFSVDFGGIKSPPSARTESVPSVVSGSYIKTLTISRPLGFYGVRLEASGFQSWYSKDSLKTPIERFYWGTVSFDCDNACLKQTTLKQSRQIIICGEVQQLANGLLAVPENEDLRTAVVHLLPSRLSGFIHWEDMAAEVSFFGIVESWTTQWES